MITVQQAHEIIRTATVTGLQTESVPLHELTGRVIAEQIRAEFPMPRFTNAAMDGFAVMRDDLGDASEDRPARLPVTQEIPAGSSCSTHLASRSCAMIMTGAPVPPGADTVVPFEETSGFGQTEVEFYRVPKRGANIRHTGEEVEADTVIVESGTRVTPAEVAILAAFGRASLPAYRIPNVALLTVGDELRMPGEAAVPLSIFNSNLPMLDACVRACGARVSAALQLPDDRNLIRQALEASLEHADMLVTAGGISTGEYDFVQETLTGLGIRQGFWKVAQKPGKPLYFGTAPSGALVFSLPGNPVSALACFLEYCSPALSRLQGIEPQPKVEAWLETPFPSDPKRHRFLFGRIRTEGGRLLCSVSSKTESHMLTAAGGSNCIVESPPVPEHLPAGRLVTCAPLPWTLQAC